MKGRHGFGFGRGFGMGQCREFPRVRRGDMKYLLLEILKGGPRHGYEIIVELESSFRGYRASPGSVYPTLQMLEEGGYLTGEQVEGKKVYTITDKGLKLLEERGGPCLEVTPEMKRAMELRQAVKKLASAVIDGARGSDEATKKRIGEILDRARKDIYAVLAES
ncbi:MAG: PadR family transcriptional regulator [Chloracidobacterium sp.]|nr:PadR family transcriptional regulator [Chloracidobacterium sp.]